VGGGVHLHPTHRYAGHRDLHRVPQLSRGEQHPLSQTGKCKVSPLCRPAIGCYFARRLRRGTGLTILAVIVADILFTYEVCLLKLAYTCTVPSAGALMYLYIRLSVWYPGDERQLRPLPHCQHVRRVRHHHESAARGKLMWFIVSQYKGNAAEMNESLIRSRWKPCPYPCARIILIAVHTLGCVFLAGGSAGHDGAHDPPRHRVEGLRVHLQTGRH
jgi:hypothetical protein